MSAKIAHYSVIIYINNEYYANLYRDVQKKHNPNRGGRLSVLFQTAVFFHEKKGSGDLKFHDNS